MYSIFSSGTKKNLDKKIVKISSKRQITIPQKFFKILEFNDVAECILRDGELVIRPARVNSDGKFMEDIIKDLFAEGFSGEEFLSEFKVRYKKELFLKMIFNKMKIEKFWETKRKHKVHKKYTKNTQLRVLTGNSGHVIMVV